MISIESAIPRLKEFTERQFPTLNALGLAVGLTHREQTLHVSFYGLANREAGQSITPETLFQIGSIRKSLTCILLLQLKEQGLLDITFIDGKAMQAILPGGAYSRTFTP